MSDGDKPYDFEENLRKNREKEDRIRQERERQNRNVVKSYRLLKEKGKKK